MVVLRRARRAIPTSDASAFRRVVVRTHAVRWVLALSALALLAAGFSFTRGLEQQRSGLVPPGSSAVVVLDVSLSITDRDFRRSRRVLERLIASRTPVGLVVFSDIPYELLPPGTPARELRPLLRLLTPQAGRLPPNPWQTSFSAGTLISASLELAQQMLRRDRVEDGSILLVSDLQTAPQDYGQLGRTLSRLRRSSISVRVAALSPPSDGLALFERLLGPDAFVDPIEPSEGPVPRIESSLRGRTPIGLLIAGALLFLALAAHEQFAGRLALPRPGWRSS
jgi:von Willebrand factor type A domain